MCFRYVPASLDDDESLNQLNQAIMADLQVEGRAFLAGTDIRGRFALRSCALHYALDEGHVQAIVDAVRDAGEILILGPSGAKAELAKYIREHNPQVGGRIVAVETADHPSDPEIVAFAKRHFKIGIVRSAADYG